MKRSKDLPARKSAAARQSALMTNPNQAGINAGPSQDEVIRKIATICKADEIAIRMPDATRAMGLLATIKTLGIEVFAHCCVPARQGALTLVVTDKPQRAKAVLEQAGLECQTSPVVLVSAPPQTAIAAQLGMQLTAAQIGIRYCYATAPDAPQAHVVFKTTDDDHAIRVLQAATATQNQGVQSQLPQPK